MILTVVRIERMGSRTGPYRSNGRNGVKSVDNMLNRHTTEEKHPTIYEDKKLSGHNLSDFTGKYRFAFRNIPQLFNWFTKKELNLLYKYGYRIYYFNIHTRHLILGSKQCVIKTCKAFENRMEISPKQLKSLFNYHLGD
jgi:hypothetical protein